MLRRSLALLVAMAVLGCGDEGPPLETRTGQVYYVGTKAIYVGPVGGGFDRFRSDYFAHMWGANNDGENRGPDPLDGDYRSKYGIQLVEGDWHSVTFGDIVSMKGYHPVGDAVIDFFSKETTVTTPCPSHDKCIGTFPQLMGK